MLKIRLQRIGRKNDPAFRAVLTDSKNSTKSGRFLEIVGTYNPKAGEAKFDGERIKHWVSKGAQLSDTMRNLLITKKIITGKKVNALPKKRPIKKELTEEEKKAAEAATKPAEAPKAEEKKEEVKA